MCRIHSTQNFVRTLLVFRLPHFVWMNIEYIMAQFARQTVFPAHRIYIDFAFLVLWLMLSWEMLLKIFIEKAGGDSKKKTGRIDRLFYYLCTVQCAVFHVRINGFFIFCVSAGPWHLSIRQATTLFVLFFIRFFLRKIMSFVWSGTGKSFLLKFQEFCKATNKSARFTFFFSPFLRHNFAPFDWTQPQIQNSPIEDWTISFRFRSRIYSRSKWIISGIQTILLTFVMTHGTWRTDANRPQKKTMRKRKETKQSSRDLCVSQRDKHECRIFQFIFLRKREYKRSHAFQWFQLKRAVALAAELISAFSSECSIENKGHSSRKTLCCVLGRQTPVSYMENIWKMVFVAPRARLFCLLAAAPPTHRMHTMYIVHECGCHVGTAQVHTRESWKLYPLNPLPYAAYVCWMLVRTCAHSHTPNSQCYKMQK